VWIILSCVNWVQWFAHNWIYWMGGPLWLSQVFDYVRNTLGRGVTQYGLVVITPRCISSSQSKWRVGNQHRRQSEVWNNDRNCLLHCMAWSQMTCREPHSYQERVGCTVVPLVNGECTNRRMIPEGSSIPHRYTRVSNEAEVGSTGQCSVARSELCGLWMRMKFVAVEPQPWVRCCNGTKLFELYV
jgi:hypothetical protein